MIDWGSWDAYLETSTSVPLLFLLPEDLVVDQGCLHPGRLTDLDHGAGRKMKRFSRLGFDIWPKEKHTRIPPSGEGRNLEGVAAKMRHLKSRVSGLILPAPSPPSTHPSISFPISGEAVASLGFIFNSCKSWRRRSPFHSPPPWPPSLSPSKHTGSVLLNHPRKRGGLSWLPQRPHIFTSSFSYQPPPIKSDQAS